MVHLGHLQVLGLDLFNVNGLLTLAYGLHFKCFQALEHFQFHDLWHIAEGRLFILPCSRCGKSSERLPYQSGLSSW